MINMKNKSVRKIVFVCSAIDNGNLISKIIVADNPANAASLFLEQNKISPKEILGPFYKKRARVIQSTRTLKFTNESKKAVYDNWLVNALLLKEPEDHAFLVFIKRLDDKKVSSPKGTVVIPISELRFQ